MKKIALLYSYADLGRVSQDEARVMFLSGPDNIGNLVYLETLRSMFHDVDLLSAAEMIENPVRVAETYHKVLLPFSNMLSPYFSSPLVDLIVKYNIPVILFSIGVQAPLGSTLSDIELSADSLKLLEYCSSNNSLVGVRGELSRELLLRYGINSKVVGCPSFTRVSQLADVRGDRLVVNSTLSGHHRELSAGIISFGIKNKAHYALQDEGRIIADRYDIKIPSINFGNPDSPYAKEFSNLFFDYGYYNDGAYEWGVQRDWFRKFSFFLTSFSDWNAQLAKFDLSIGTRIHGNSLALLNGIPALFVPCDLRCLELCRYHMLPTVDFIDFNSSLEAIFDLVNYEAFFQNNENVKNNLTEYWGRVGVFEYIN